MFIQTLRAVLVKRIGTHQPHHFTLDRLSLATKEIHAPPQANPGQRETLDTQKRLIFGKSDAPAIASEMKNEKKNTN